MAALGKMVNFKWQNDVERGSLVEMQITQLIFLPAFYLTVKNLT